MSSPPRIQRDHGDMPDDMVLFPIGDDSSDYMSPELTRPPVHHQQHQQEEEADRGSPVEFPADESHADTSSRITKGKVAASSVAETKTTAQMTNLTERSEHPRTEDAWDFEMELMTKSRVFRSVLSQPIPVWNDMEEAVLQYAPQWKPAQRSKLIELWVKFMELKVIVEDYSGNEEDLLLAPTQLIGRVWYSITQNSHLYQEVLYWIQDYHDKDRCLIYRPPLTLSPSNFNDSHSQEEGDSSSGGGGGGPNSSSDHAAKDDDTAIAHFQEGSHHRLERAQRLFICYFQQAMPESLKAVNNMSKRRSSETIQENNIVAENASDAGDSDFSGNDDDCDDHDHDDDMELDNKSVHTEASENWITKFQSWLSCWEDPFGSNASTSATAEPKKKARSQNELLREQEGNDASFWPCATTNNVKDDVEIIRRSNNIGQPNAGSADDPLPALNETDEQSSTLWVTFDSKQDTTVEDDELTFLTMDTALDKGSPEKRGKKKAKFYSPPRRFQAGHQQATITTPPTPQTPQSPKKPPPSSYAAQYSSPRKTKNKLPSVAAQQRKAPPTPSAAAAAAGAATPPPKAATKAQAKQQREQEKKEMNWKALKAKFRIASMILKEFE
ncbi:unnamed protein product [Cylindrotheca closterium]|uniref:Uncharacterized protein n=1 Tax=Cylindrotheca closterium TaxID=2856 RepID=A0AAD2CFC4_9STRA|nr:unnamed protein product [Cylindrotheca closterium]